MAIIGDGTASLLESCASPKKERRATLQAPMATHCNETGAHGEGTTHKYDNSKRAPGMYMLVSCPLHIFYN